MNRHISDIAPIRLGVECAITFKGKILLQNRSMDSKFFPGYLSYPGGNVDENEDNLKAIIREVREETGVDISKENIQLVVNSINYNKEKKVIWVVCAFKVELTKLQDVTSSIEGECQWFDIKTLDRARLVPPMLIRFERILESKPGVCFIYSEYINGETRLISSSESR